MGLLRRRSAPVPDPAPVDPLAGLDRSLVPPRLLPAVDAAIAAAHRYRHLVAQRPEGPVRARMIELGTQVEAGVAAVHATAVHAAQLDAVAATLDVEAATAEYKAARRDGAPPELVEARKARFESIQRVLNARDDIDERLALIEARLEAAVARAAELALSGAAALDAAEADLASVTDELAGLRAALDSLA